MAGAGLKRLARLYGMVENLHAMQVQSAAGAVEEVNRLAVRLKQARHDEVNRGRVALAGGSRVESMATERTAASEETRRHVLAQMKTQRKEAHHAAVVAHRVSRLEMRQIDGVVERARMVQKLTDDRRMQAMSDDRFLSRREWMKAKELREQG